MNPVRFMQWIVKPGDKLYIGESGQLLEKKCTSTTKIGSNSKQNKEHTTVIDHFIIDGT